MINPTLANIVMLGKSNILSVSWCLDKFKIFSMTLHHYVVWSWGLFLLKTYIVVLLFLLPYWIFLMSLLPLILKLLFILQIVHGNQSCSGHFISFLIQAYKRALPVYLPVYLIPALIVHRKGLLKRWLHLTYLISFLVWVIGDIWGWNVWHFSFEWNTIASESSVRKILDGSSIFLI